MNFQQDDHYQRLMLKTLEQNGDQYFMHLASRGLRLPLDFDVDGFIQKREPSPLEVSIKKIQNLENEMSSLKREKDEPKSSFSM